jgi:hypothetical protein
MFGLPDVMTIAETKALQGRRRLLATTIGTCGALCMVLAWRRSGGKIPALRNISQSEVVRPQ